MSIQLNLDVQEVNTIIEGLARVQDNAARLSNVVRNQATAQLQAAQAAAQAQAEVDAQPTGAEPAQA